MKTTDRSPLAETLEMMREILEISYPLCKNQDPLISSKCSKINTLAFKAIKNIDGKLCPNNRKK